MHKFTDTLGRDWLINVNVATVKRVKAATGIDILSFLMPEEGKPNPLADTNKNAEAVVDILVPLCEGQLKERGIDANGFAEAFNGETLENAANALYEDIIDFFPQPYRDYWRQAKAKLDAAKTDITESLSKALREGGIERFNEVLSKLSTDSQES